MAGGDEAEKGEEEEEGEAGEEAGRFSSSGAVWGRVGAAWYIGGLLEWYGNAAGRPRFLPAPSPPLPAAAADENSAGLGCEGACGRFSKCFLRASLSFSSFALAVSNARCS